MGLCKEAAGLDVQWSRMNSSSSSRVSSSSSSTAFCGPQGALPFIFCIGLGGLPAAADCAMLPQECLAGVIGGAAAAAVG
jgi:hypothetical protein